MLAALTRYFSCRSPPLRWKKKKNQRPLLPPIRKPARPCGSAGSAASRRNSIIMSLQKPINYYYDSGMRLPSRGFSTRIIISTKEATGNHFNLDKSEPSQSSSPPRTTDGYVWPNLYEEACGMAMASFISYPITFLLREARMGRLKNSTSILKRLEHTSNNSSSSSSSGTFLNPGDFLDVVRDNIDYISSNYHAGDELHGWQSVFYLYQQANDNIQLREFDDRQEATRLVYGIAINKTMKRITVIFRGTYADATSDMKRNLQVQQVEVPLPSSAIGSADTTKICIYQGIYEYLLQNSERGPDYPQERYEEILGHLLQCIEEHPDFKVFVTGHSTGGALALLLSFYLACDDRIPQPVTSVSIGSQLLGDSTFQRAFEGLEMEGRLRHLRITNEHDPIPHMPPMRWYRPVGMHLYLHHTSPLSLRHHHTGFDIQHASARKERRNHQEWRAVPGGQGWWTSMQHIWKSYQEANHNIDQMVEWHNLPAYLRRLERNKKALQQLTLNECYRSDRWTGSHFHTRL